MWVESDGPGAGLDLPLHDRARRSPTCRRHAGASSSARSRRCRASAARRRRQRHQPAHPGAADGQVGHAVARHRIARRSAALAATRGDAFDLAILDMHMPAMDGVELARAHPRSCGRHCRWCSSARSAGARRVTPTACSPPTWPSRCARAQLFDTLVGLLARDARAARPAPAPASRDRRRAWPSAIRCASCWPRTTS